MLGTASDKIRSVRLYASLGALACFGIAFFATPHLPGFFLAVIVGITSFAGGFACLTISHNYGKGAAAGLSTIQITLLGTIEKNPGATLGAIKAALNKHLMSKPIASAADRSIEDLVRSGLVAAETHREVAGQEIAAFRLTYNGELALKCART